MFTNQARSHPRNQTTTYMAFHRMAKMWPNPTKLCYDFRAYLREYDEWAEKSSLNNSVNTSALGVDQSSLNNTWGGSPTVGSPPPTNGGTPQQKDYSPYLRKISYQVS